MAESEMMLPQEVAQSSDVIYDFPCTPCSDDGNNTESVSFCAECQSYFCSKNHTLFNKSSVKSGIVQYRQQQTNASALSCEKHPGNIIQMYCGEHDSVSCAVCIAVDHRLCKGVDYIPKLTKKILNGRDRNDVNASLEQLGKDLNKIKSSKLAKQSNANIAKEELLNQIENTKERIFARVKELERKSIELVEDRCKEIVDAINRDIKGVDDMMKSMEKQVEQIKQFRGDNEAKLFVLLNRGHELESGCINLMENDGKIIYENMAFEFNKDIETYLNGIESFGFSVDDASHSNTASVTCTVSLLGEYDVGIRDEDDESNVLDTCMLDNGQIVVCCGNKLMRLDKVYHVTDYCDVSAEGVCMIGPKELAIISNSSMIQFVHVGRSMIPTRSFKIDYKKPGVHPESGVSVRALTFNGIAFSSRKLFIAANIYTHFNGSRDICAVLVYDVRGDHLRTIHAKQNGESMFSDIYHLSLNSDGSRLYVADAKLGLITMDMNGQILSEVTDERLKGARGVAVGDNGQVFVCGYDSHNVFLVDKHGNIVEEILGRCDGIEHPRSVMYLRQKKHLLVAKSNKIQVFKLT